MFEKEKQYMIAAYERHDVEDGVPEYEFLFNRVRALSKSNYERRLLTMLVDAMDFAAVDEHDGVCVVAYEKADGALCYEDSSVAVISYEHIPGRGVDQWVEEEIAEQIQLW